MTVAYCLDCGGRIYLGRRPWVGQAAYCERCGSDLEVTKVSPLTVDWIDDLVDEDSEESVGLDRELVPA
jgi:RNA polymerase-binding transcription factor DksA